jgi:hypothetical protein
LLYIILIEIGENKHWGNNPGAGNNSSIISSLLKKIPGLSRTLSVSKDFPGLDFFKQIQGLSSIFKDRGDPGS